jgi:hypothetical protein
MSMERKEFPHLLTKALITPSRSGSNIPGREAGGPIRMHAGIQGEGDLSVALHGWANPVTKVRITNLS